jgi:uncharacterized surface protein with fasciclin (FAS1) repeats
MRLSSLLVALSVIVPSALAQNSTEYASGLQSALNSAGLTVLAGLVKSAPPALVQALQDGNHTVFAPSDAALAGAAGVLASGANVTQILQYHVAAGAVNTTALNSTQTVVRSTLSSAPAVFLPANQSQVLLLFKNDGNTVLNNAGTNVTVVQNATYNNLNILVIDHVLNIPKNLSDVVTGTPQLSALAAAVNQKLPNLIGSLNKARGVTLFLPVNEAITGAADAINSVNDTTLTNVLLNHIINGTALYAPQITNGLNITGAGGEPLTFTSNSTGTWVTSGSASAQIIRPNILTSNGVIHLIDSVLLNTASNPDAATSAAASISSSEAQNTATETGPVTPSSTGGVVSAVQVDLPFKLLFTALAGAFLGASVL